MVLFDNNLEFYEAIQKTPNSSQEGPYLQLYGKYHISRSFGWPVINDKHANANMYMEMSSPKSYTIASKLVTLNPC
jgi:hypothetical protein